MQNVGRVLKGATIEVERKFNITAALSTHLSKPSGHALFTVPHHHNQQHAAVFRREVLIHDEYFDQDGTLEAHNIWLRERSIFPVPGGPPSTIVWEAKIRNGGDQTNSHFIEVCGRSQILSTLAGLDLPLKWFPLRRRGTALQLKTTAWIFFTREIWDVADMTLVLDKARELPDVGEVEMTKTIGGDGAESIIEDGKMIVDARQAMDKKLTEFMTANQTLFPVVPHPVGKLQAYRDLGKSAQIVSDFLVLTGEDSEKLDIY